MTEPPSHAYFRPKHGRWAGEYVFAVESLRALFAGAMGRQDKIGFAALGLLCRVLGALRIETTVDASALLEGRVHHTTRISKWGIPLQSSEESFALGADGRTLAVTGAVRTVPLWWLARPYRDSRGEVDEAGQCASYELAWSGSKIVQRSTPDGDALGFVQEADGCRATFVLRHAK